MFRRPQPKGVRDQDLRASVHRPRGRRTASPARCSTEPASASGPPLSPCVVPVSSCACGRAAVPTAKTSTAGRSGTGPTASPQPTGAGHRRTEARREPDPRAPDQGRPDDGRRCRRRVRARGRCAGRRTAPRPARTPQRGQAIPLPRRAAARTRRAAGLPPANRAGRRPAPPTGSGPAPAAVRPPAVPSGSRRTREAGSSSARPWSPCSASQSAVSCHHEGIDAKLPWLASVARPGRRRGQQQWHQRDRQEASRGDAGDACAANDRPPPPRGRPRVAPPRGCAPGPRRAPASAAA